MIRQIISADHHMTRDEACRIAANIAKLPELLTGSSVGQFGLSEP